jgi:hypothetical protein
MTYVYRNDFDLGIFDAPPLGIAPGTRYGSRLLPCPADPKIPIPPMRRPR